MKHNHITYKEIKKYVKTGSDILFKNDMAFFENFNDRLDSCDDCAKRFEAYAWISAILDPDKEDNVSMWDVVIKEVNNFKNVLSDHAEKAREFITGGFSVKPLGVPAIARSLGLEEVSIDVLNNGGFHDCFFADGVDEIYEFYEFELSASAMLAIDMPPELDKNKKYECILWRTADYKTFSFPVKKNETGKLFAITDPDDFMQAGRYLMIVVCL